MIAHQAEDIERYNNLLFKTAENNVNKVNTSDARSVQDQVKVLRAEIKERQDQIE